MSDHSAIEVIDPRFLELISPKAELRTLSTGHRWVEGPVWVPHLNALLFSDIPNQKIHKWSETSGVSVFRQNSDFANGNTLDGQGRLVTCQHGTRSVTRTEQDGRITPLANAYMGKPLNSPNDVVVKSDGTIWFTDPTYGIISNVEGYEAPQEQAGRYVFRLSPETGDLDAVVTDFTQPNGLAFSCDESRLYIADSAKSHDPDFPPVVRVFDVDAAGDLTDQGIFATLDTGLPDGLRVDEHDNVWISAGDGVHCFSAAGELLGKVKTSEVVANLTFGGDSGTELFMTATSSVYAIETKVRSALASRQTNTELRRD